MVAKKFSIGDIVNKSWQIAKKNVWIFAGVIVLYVVLCLLVGVFLGAYSTPISPDSYLGLPPEVILQQVLQQSLGSVALIQNVVFLVLTSFFSLGYFRMTLDAVSNIEPNFSAFSVNIKKLLNAIAGAFIYNVIVVIGVCLCIIPGIIFAARLQLYYFFIIEKDSNVIEAISQSWEATKGKTLDLVLLGIVYFFVNVLGFICCGIGILITLPMSYVGMTLIYRNLTEEIPQDVDFEALSDTENS